MADLFPRALRLVLVVLVLLPSLPGQQPEKPRFDKYHVVPYGSYWPGILTTGEFVSILGWHLTPKQWCGASHTQEPPYPLTVCGVQVLIGGHLSGLMYVGQAGNNVMNADQINFQVPANVKAEGEVPIQACIANTCSEPLNIAFTNKDILLRVDGKAYAHMPLWVEFTIPYNNSFGYPASDCPWDFGGFQIEVRKDGHALPSSPMPKCADVDRRGSLSAISLQKGVAHRLPVHLYHLFDAPGEYELRMSGPLLTPDLSKVSRTGYSDWIRVTVERYSETERQAWLDSVTRAVPSENAQRHESELIVSLLAQPDEKALKALLNFLPPPPPPSPPPTQAPVRRILNGNLRMNWTRDCLAPAALAAFPDAVLKKHIPPARLLDLRKTPAYCYWR